MTNVKLLATALLTATSVGLSSSLHAQMSTSNVYLGAGIGQTKFKDACEASSAAGLSCDDSDTGYRFFGGYQFNRNLAAEIGYAELGKATSSGVVLGVPVSGNWKARVWDVVAVGIMPLNEQFSLLGKLGVALWRLDASLIPAATSSPTGTDLTWGIGGQYDFTKKVGMRVEWQKYKDIGDDTTGKSDASAFSASALFRF